MADHKDALPEKEYRRNQQILLVVQGILALSGLWFIYLLLVTGHQATTLVNFLFSCIAGVVACVFVYKLETENNNDIIRTNHTWSRGSKTEQLVARDLKKLHPHYQVFQDFPTGHGTIDFILVGPKGVFTLEVKSARGAIRYTPWHLVIDGHDRGEHDVEQAHKERVWLEELLHKHFKKRYAVTGLLYFPHADVVHEEIHDLLEGIWIGGYKFYEQLIAHSPYRLSQDDIDHICQILIEKKEFRD